MSDWSDVFLGIIAVATLATAIVQIGVLVAAGMLARRIGRLPEQVERDLSPLIASLNAIGQDAARARHWRRLKWNASIASSAMPCQRLETSLNVIQTAISVPAREGAALMVGLRAVLDSLRRGAANRPSRTRSSDEEDALFI